MNVIDNSESKNQPNLIIWLRSFSEKASITVFLIGLVVIVAWLFNIELFKGILPGMPTMKLNTALGFVLGGSSLWLWNWKFKIKIKNLKIKIRFLIYILSFLIIIIASLTLLEYSFNVSLGIDQILMQQPEPSGSTAPPGRMAPNTALAHLLVGFALLLLNDRHPRYLAVHSLALGAWLIAFLGLLGYIYKRVYFYTAGFYTGMAIHTAISFLLLTSGILCGRPKRGIMPLISGDGLGSAMARRLLLVAIVVPLLVKALSNLGYQRQLYSAEMATALENVLNTVAFIGAIAWNGWMLNRTDYRRKQAELQLQQFNAELEQRVENRTAELKQTQLALQQANTNLEMRVSERTAQLQEELRIRQQAEEALVASQARFAGILEIASDAIISIDINQRITLFNQGAEKIFGYTASEAYGQSLDLLLPNRFANSHQRQISNFSDSAGKARRMGERSEIFGRRKDGTEFPAEASISKLQIGSELILTAFLRDITERKQIEAELSQLAAIVEYSNDAIISKTLDGDIVTWNAGAERLFGYTASEVVGRNISLLIPPQQLDEENSLREKIKRGERIEYYQTARRCKNGKQVYISLTISPIKEATGKIVGASKIARDITQSKQAEELLRESEERFRSAFDNAAMGMALIGLDRQYLKVNRFLCEVTGYSETELLTMTCPAISSPDDLDSYGNLVKQLLDGKIHNYQVERRFLHKSGRVILLSFNVSLVRNEAKILYYITQIQDITERKQNEITLQIQSEIVNNMPGGVCLIRATDWTIVYANPKFERMFGYNSGELNGKIVHILNYEGERKAAQTTSEILAQINKLGEATYEVCNIKKDGTIFWCQAHTSTFNHPEFGRVYVAVQEDITEMKKAQDPVKKSLKEK